VTTIAVTTRTTVTTRNRGKGNARLWLSIQADTPDKNTNILPIHHHTQRNQMRKEKRKENQQEKQTDKTCMCI
jgi:hypothetical protein